MAKKSHAVAVLEARIHQLEAEEREALAAHTAIEAVLIELRKTWDQVQSLKVAAKPRKTRKDKGTRRAASNNEAPAITAEQAEAQLCKLVREL